MQRRQLDQNRLWGWHGSKGSETKALKARPVVQRDSGQQADPRSEIVGCIAILSIEVSRDANFSPAFCIR
jgi:hypothetical protein